MADEARAITIEGEAGGGVTSKVGEHMIRFTQEGGRGPLEAPTKILHGKSDVGPRRRGGVHEAADALLERLQELGVRAGGQRESIGDRLKKRRRVGELGAGPRRSILGEETLDELANVGGLVKLDRSVGEVVDLDAEEILHGALVRHLPVRCELVHEGVVRAPLGTTAVGIELRRVHDLKIVDVDANREDLAVRMLSGEDARVRVVEGLETLLLEPREEHALEATPGLLDAVDGLVDASDEGLAVGIVLGIARR